MIAIDTNIIIRYVVADDPGQTHRSHQIVDLQDVFVPTTVVMEIEWVLRSIYRFTSTEIVDAFRTFAGMPTVTIEDADIVSTALELLLQGMDFADALHLLKTRHCEGFTTFDRKFVKLAQKAGFENVIEG